MKDNFVYFIVSKGPFMIVDTDRAIDQNVRGDKKFENEIRPQFRFSVKNFQNLYIHFLPTSSGPTAF